MAIPQLIIAAVLGGITTPTINGLWNHFSRRRELAATAGDRSSLASLNDRLAEKAAAEASEDEVDAFEKLWNAYEAQVDTNRRLSEVAQADRKQAHEDRIELLSRIDKLSAKVDILQSDVSAFKRAEARFLLEAEEKDRTIGDLRNALAAREQQLATLHISSVPQPLPVSVEGRTPTT